MKTYSSGFHNPAQLLPWFKHFIVPVLATVGLGLVSCASDRSAMREPTGVTVSDEIRSVYPLKFKSMAVIDFYEGRHPNAQGTAYVCNITGFGFVSGQVATGSGELVSDQFRFALSKRGIEMVSGESTMEALKEAGTDVIFEYGVKLGVFVGEKLGVDAVLMGSVMRFEELVGGKFLADKPASVAFSTAVIDVRAKQIIWKSKFEKTQTSLFSNILDYKTFFKGGMTWQKAHQLSTIGVGNTLGKIKIGSPER